MTISKFPNPHQIEAEACAWIAQLDGTTPSRQDLTAFREWVNRGPQHRAEITRLAALWSDLNLLTELAIPAKKSAPRPGRSQLLLSTAIGAVFAVLITAVTIYCYRPSMFAGDRDLLYSTYVGEQKSVVLADGSRVLLNTDSRVEVTYRSGQRVVHLLRGEAYFQVAHNPARPFLVYAGSNVVRAVGTAFTVHLEKRDVEVVVTDGTIEISTIILVSDVATAPKTPIKSVVRLAAIKAGQTAAFNQAVESIQSIKPSDIERRLSWRAGILSFSGEPLDQVVEEISRYTPVTIVISDPAIRKVRIGGYFKVGETDAVLEALETSFGVRVTRVSDRLVYLTAK